MKTKKLLKPLRIYRKIEDCRRDAAQFNHRIDCQRGNLNSYACAVRNDESMKFAST